MRRNTILAVAWFFTAMLLAACFVALSGCRMFEGPATKEYACPVDCGHGVCCSTLEECSVYPDRPSKFVGYGAVRDASSE